MWSQVKSLILHTFALLGRLFVRWMEAIGRTAPLSLEAGFLMVVKARPDEPADRPSTGLTEADAAPRVDGASLAEGRLLCELSDLSGPCLSSVHPLPRRRRLDRRHGALHLGR